MSEDVLANRVRKLLDKAEATSNPHEAEAFSRKAAELIARHTIDPDRLRANGSGDVLAIRDFELGRGAYVRARLALLMAVATPQNVRIVFSSGPTGMIAHGAGFESDLDLVEMSYNSLHQQAASQMAMVRRSTPAATQRYRRSFLFGYAERVGEMLRKARCAAVVDVSGGAQQSRSAELALKDRLALVDEFVAESFGRLGAARRPTAAQARGWGAGAEAASRSDVGRSRLAGRPAIGPG